MRLDNKLFQERAGDPGSEVTITHIDQMKTMMTEKYNKDTYSELIKQHQILIDDIVLAINESIKTNKFTAETPAWKTHSPWEKKVLPNLSKTQANLTSANDELINGNEDEAHRMSGVVGGIGKDIDDFDTSWMDDISKSKIDNQLDLVVGLADSISRGR